MKFYNKSKAFFFDRDGVIIRDVGYLINKESIIFYKDIFRVLDYIQKNNFLIIIITNQSVVGRKLINKKELSNIHKYITDQLKKKKITVQDIFYCPHHPTDGVGHYKRKCFCRKPGNLLIEKAIKKWNIDRTKSYMIGDKKTDLLASKKSKIKFFYRPKKYFYKFISNKIK
ncbi:HAD-IIIA family hydrolase [Candidatus Pelagibacter sp.]|nr:HAD-IIIA family hydrolase [Candidatus Pelagibacter sp.]